jgi:glycosyltransferase involved in cell wall biosynthesis
VPAYINDTSRVERERGGLVMRIAILGARGIPASYGGYETLIEELSLGLVKSNASDVLVYCRKGYYENHPATYGGVQLVYLPAPRSKAFESLFHSFIASLHVLRQSVDVVYFVDPANAPFCLLLRMCGKKVIIHTDGLGWKRTKWGPLARRYYKFVEWLSARTAHALVTDNPAMEKYYKSEYGADSTYIPYGAQSHYGEDDTVYKEFGLDPDGYLLVVARLEPENNTDLIISEYVRSKVMLPLVVVGDAPYSSHYMQRLKSLANEKVIFTGRLNDQPKLNALYRGAFLYIHGHEVGGTNPSLLRAMNAATAPLVLNVNFNTSVVADCGFVFEKKRGALAEELDKILSNPADAKVLGQKAHARAESLFRWDSVVSNHYRLFVKVAKT